MKPTSEPGVVIPLVAETDLPPDSQERVEAARKRAAKIIRRRGEEKPNGLRQLGEQIKDQQVVRLAESVPELAAHYLSHRADLRTLVHALTTEERTKWARDTGLCILACVRDLVPEAVWTDKACGPPPTDEDLSPAFFSALACMVLATPSRYWEPDVLPPSLGGYNVEEPLDEWLECIDVELLPPGDFWNDLRAAFLCHWYRPCREMGAKLVAAGE